MSEMQEDAVKVSVIVPVYNREKLVARAINSVVEQSYSNWELLLVDDASTDNTKKVISKFSARDSRIKLLSNVNSKGPSGARNTGLSASTGKYIAYLDSDDEWVRFHLEKMIYYLEKYEDKISLMSADPLRKKESTGEVVSYDKLDTSKIKFDKIEDGYLIDNSQLFDKQLTGRVITTQCIVGKAELMKSILWNESLGAGEDNLHNLTLCSKPIGVCHLADFHAIYWIHDDNLSNVSGNHDLERVEKLNLAFVDYWKILLSDFVLTNKQKNYIKENLSACLAWHLGYSVYEKQGRYAKSINFYLKAIAYQPCNLKIYKSFFSSVLKYFIRRGL